MLNPFFDSINLLILLVYCRACAPAPKIRSETSRPLRSKAPRIKHNVAFQESKESASDSETKQQSDSNKHYESESQSESIANAQESTSEWEDKLPHKLVKLSIVLLQIEAILLSGPE